MKRRASVSKKEDSYSDNENVKPLENTKPISTNEKGIVVINENRLFDINSLEMKPKKKVTFGLGSEILFDKKDAPSNNILDVIRIPTIEQKKEVIVEEEQVMFEDNLSLVSNIFAFEEKAISDTNLLSSEELSKELEARGLDPTGKKHEKLERLEKYLSATKNEIAPNKREVLLKRQKNQPLAKKGWLQKRGQFGSKGSIPQGWR